MALTTVKELTAKIAEKEGIPKLQAYKVWMDICEILKDELTAGNKVRLRNIGTISRRDRKAKPFRLPNGTEGVSTPKFGFKLASNTYAL